MPLEVSLTIKKLSVDVVSDSVGTRKSFRVEMFTAISVTVHVPLRVGLPERAPEWDTNRT